jgi:glycerol-3-phosphate acyltransferase PlsX
MALTTPVIISLDAMGGDFAPDIVLNGVKIARERLPHVRYLLFGDEKKLRPFLDKNPDVSDLCEIRHTDQAILGHDKPSQVLRSGRQSSMWLAVSSVSQGEAAGVVSAGNTGALMAISKFVLRMLPGIARPAIAGLLPTTRGECVMLDLGANIDCDSNNLVEFAVMGEVFARIILGIERPTVGLLNVGSEDVKGNDSVRGAAAILKEGQLPMQFYGFIEGDDIMAGTVDVVVSDGFSGNIALKAAEGTVKLYKQILRDAFSSSLLSKIGYFLAQSALTKVKMRTDPRRYNGAVFVGLNGIAVKSHGGSDALGFANAICVAADLIAQNFNNRIKSELEYFRSHEQTSPQKEDL